MMYLSDTHQNIQDLIKNKKIEKGQLKKDVFILKLKKKIYYLFSYMRMHCGGKKSLMMIGLLTSKVFRGKLTFTCP